MRIILAPAKTNAPLLIDPNAVLSGAIASQLLQPIPRRYAEFVQPHGGIENAEFAQHDAPQISGKAPHRLAPPQSLSIAVAKAAVHPI